MKRKIKAKEESIVRKGKKIKTTIEKKKERERE
jgi:hypothetical protein